MLPLLQLLLPKVAAHHRVAVLIDAINEVLAGHTDHASLPSLQASIVDKTQSGKNRCRYPYGGRLQLQKGVAPLCLTETQTTSNQPSIGNFGVKRGLGCWRGHKRFGMTGCPMKHRRSIQSSPGVLLWASEFCP